MASAHYLDAAILAKRSPPATSPDTTRRIAETARSDDGGNKVAIGSGGEARPTAQPVSVSKESYAGPVVFMSDSDNYTAGASGPRRRVKVACGMTCCVG